MVIRWQRLVLLLLLAVCTSDARKRLRLNRKRFSHKRHRYSREHTIHATNAANRSELTNKQGSQKQRFFAYDLDPPNYGERFSTRKRYSVHAFHFVKMLEKLDPDHEWTLVLAPFTTTFDGQRTFTPWRSLFDLTQLRNVFPRIMDYEDFMKQHGNYVDYFVALSPGDKECKTYPSYELTATGKSTPMMAMGQKVTG